jgi:hypothetical protein
MAPINRVSVVMCDAATLQFRWTRGTTASIHWDDVQRVVIRTTDRGPFDDDVFLVLVTCSRSYVIPQQAAGAKELLSRLQQLPGFDNEAVIESMGCTDNRDFPCWERAESAVENQRPED